MPARKKITMASAPNTGTPVRVEHVPIQLPKMYPWQLRVRAALAEHRFAVVSSARQVGKTEFAVLWAMDGAMQGEDVWWIAPTNRLANAGYDKLNRYTQQAPFNQTFDGQRMVTQYKQRRLFTFHNAGKIGTIEIVSADDPETVVSGTLNRVVFDEAARAHPDAWFEGAYSTLTVRRGKALIISNPRGKNWFWTLWRRGNPDNPEYDPDYVSFTFSQFDNPALDPQWVTGQRKTMSQRQYEREVLGLFTEEGGDVFVGVKEAAYDPPIIPVRDAGHVYVGGIDWGSRQDYTVIVIHDRTAHKQVAVYAFTGLLWEEQWIKLQEIHAFWGCQLYEAEENAAGSVNIEMLRSRGLPLRAFNTNWKSKRELIDAWSAAIELKTVQILNDKELILQHESMERSEESDYGTVRFFAPQGKHDDYVIASALAYRAATVEDAHPQPSIVRGTVKGLYDNRAERSYPGWGSQSLNQMNARKQANAGLPTRRRGGY